MKKAAFLLLSLLVFSTASYGQLAGLSFFGEASWYGRFDATDPWEHRVTASGEAFDENALTCAMRRRDFGKYYRVTNLDNGKSVVVRHNDFGPAKKWRNPKTGITHDLSNRVVDLSKGAFFKIADDPKQGLLRRVKVEPIKR